MTMETPLQEICFVAPVLPGKRELLMQFAHSLMHERRAEYDASQTTVVAESWYFQLTPLGDMVIVHFKAPDIARVFANLATSEEPFDIWFRETVKEGSGIDLSQTLPVLPECILRWNK